MSEFLFDNPFLGLRYIGDEPPSPTPPANKPTDTPDPINAGEWQDKMVNLGSVYHVEWPVLKHVENSPSGILHAAHHHMSIDLDMQIDRDGTIQCTHWERPMEKDGFRHPTLPKTTPISRMSSAQVAQLHTKDGFRIHTMARMLQLAGIHHVKVRAEPKPDNHWTVEKFRELRAQQIRGGAIVVIATQDNDPNWRERMHNARAAGFPDVRRLRG